MTIYWVDHAGSNTSPYDNQTKAAPTLATILAIPPSAGDVIYCCDNAGTGETIAAELDLQSSGTNAGGFIKLIGCNSSGTVDGTRYVIDCGANGISGVDLNGQDMWWFENIEVKNTGAGTYFGFYSSAANAFGHMFVNCCANNCGSNGWYNNNTAYSVFYRSCSYLNTNHGFGSNGISNKYLLCVSRDNTGSGWNIPVLTTVLYGCVSHGNSDDGFSGIPGSATIINCVVDGNADDGFLAASSTDLTFPIIFACRITNHSGAGDIGLNCLSEPIVTGFCYFEDNDGDNIQNATLHQFIPLEGTANTSNIEDQANTNEGYVDKTNHDFSTNYTDSGDPDLRRTAITIPWS